MFALFVLFAVLALSAVSGYFWYLAMQPGSKGKAYGESVEAAAAREAAERSGKARHQRLALASALLSGTVAALGVLLNPYVRVWTYGMEGRAQMAQAEANRQIKVREAQSTRDAAILLAEAEVARAKGVAEANRIVADGLGGPEGYLRYLYIEGLKEAREKAGAQVIYVPTEAGLPILEANRLSRSAR